MPSKWRPMQDAPLWSGSGVDILCRFKHGNRYVHFVASANGKDTRQPGFAAPDEWCEIED